MFLLARIYLSNRSLPSRIFALIFKYREKILPILMTNVRFQKWDWINNKVKPREFFLV